MGNNPYQDVIDRELARYGDQVRAEYEMGGKHRRVTLFVGDKKKFLTLPMSPSDNVRGPLNMRTNLRRTLAELGVRPVDDTPVAKLASYKHSILFTVPKGSPLFKKFSTGNKEAKAWWSFVAVANPDLKGEPLFGVRWMGDIQPGEKMRALGKMRGSFNGNGDFQAMMMPAHLAPIARLGAFGTVPLTLVGETNDTMTFTFPRQRKPVATGLPEHVQEAEEKPKPKDIAPLLVPAEALTEPEESPPPPPPRAPAPARNKAPTVELTGDRPIQLVMPRESVSLKRAVDIVNAHKEKMGDNCDLSITSDGYLSVIAQYGGKKNA